MGYHCRKDYGRYYTEGIAENLFQNNGSVPDVDIGDPRAFKAATRNPSIPLGWLRPESGFVLLGCRQVLDFSSCFCAP
jgi:hypothetical protein